MPLDQLTEDLAPGTIVLMAFRVQEAEKAFFTTNSDSIKKGERYLSQIDMAGAETNWSEALTAFDLRNSDTLVVTQEEWERLFGGGASAEESR